ncbi:MAG: cation diffusion facilitator family transporter [Candidatus Heimdallarchaeaceae archaeon]
MAKIKPVQIANILSVGINMLLLILKLVIGIIFQSISLTADGLDSVLDLVTAAFAGIGEKLSRKPADSDHPFGHQKFQMVFSIAIAFVLFISSYFIANEAIQRLVKNEKILNFNFWVLIAALISLVGKFILSFFLLRIGKKIESPVIIANAKNYRTDAFSSIFVSIAFIGSYFSAWWLDPICAFIIVLLIVFTGFSILKIAIPELLDIGAPKEIIEELEDIALSFKEIKEVHIIRLRRLINYYTGDFHILVNPKLSILEAHDIAEEVKRKLEETGKFKDLIIHIEPNIPSEKLVEYSAS